MKIKFNSNQGEVARLKQAVKDNDGYCPCALEHTPDTKCMCLEFRSQTNPGPCHCGLYVKETEDEQEA